jgi:hypothetical protein
MNKFEKVIVYRKFSFAQKEKELLALIITAF